MWADPVGINGKTTYNSVGACWGPSRIFMEMHGYMVYNIGIKINLYSLLYKLMVYAED